MDVSISPMSMSLPLPPLASLLPPFVGLLILPFVGRGGGKEGRGGEEEGMSRQKMREEDGEGGARSR